MNNDLVSFQNGVDQIADGCTTYGSTPSSNTPSAIVAAIKAIYNNRYNAGVTATKKGNATAAQVLSGKTFTNASSVNISGTMTNNSDTTKSATGTLDTSNKRVQLTIPSNGYYNTSAKLYIAYSTLASLIGLTAAKIASGNTILGIAGTATATPSSFKSASLTSNKTITGLTIGRTYILNIADLQNTVVTSIKSGANILKTVNAFSLDDYSGLKTEIITILFTATATSIVLQGSITYDRIAYSLIEI